MMAKTVDKKILQAKNIIDIETMNVEDISLILDTALSMKEIMSRDIKKVPALRGKMIANMFFESSTRTRTSFEIAAKMLSADTVSFTASGSSMSKGETLLDTVRNIIAMGPDLLVMRHASSGAPYFVAKNINIPVINAGDGRHEHPSQALLDLFTIREKKGKLKGLKVSIVGDILHSRVARSDIYAFKKMGANVRLVGPPAFIPDYFRQFGAEIFYDMEKGIKDADVIIMLRIQIERQGKNFFPDIREYYELYGLKENILCFAKDDLLVMHPGPLNRGVEIDSEVADGKHSVILDQVTNGVAVRAALLYLLLGSRTDENID
ncbi:MAG TPA: aspartate carbamoyltransferase catalytic subunit [bacterium]